MAGPDHPFSRQVVEQHLVCRIGQLGRLRGYHVTQIGYCSIRGSWLSWSWACSAVLLLLSQGCLDARQRDALVGMDRIRSLRVRACRARQRVVAQ